MAIVARNRVNSIPALFLENLSEEATEGKIYELFSVFGEVLSVSIFRDSKSSPIGVACVYFKNTSDCRKAEHFMKTLFSCGQPEVAIGSQRKSEVQNCNTAHQRTSDDEECLADDLIEFSRANSVVDDEEIQKTDMEILMELFGCDDDRKDAATSTDEQHGRRGKMKMAIEGDEVIIRMKIEEVSCNLDNLDINQMRLRREREENLRSSSESTLDLEASQDSDKGENMDQGNGQRQGNGNMEREDTKVRDVLHLDGGNETETGPFQVLNEEAGQLNDNEAGLQNEEVPMLPASEETTNDSIEGRSYAEHKDGNIPDSHDDKRYQINVPSNDYLDNANSKTGDDTQGNTSQENTQGNAGLSIDKTEQLKGAASAAANIDESNGSFGQASQRNTNGNARLTKGAASKADIINDNNGANGQTSQAESTIVGKTRIVQADESSRSNFDKGKSDKETGMVGENAQAEKTEQGIEADSNNGSQNHIRASNKNKYFAKVSHKIGQRTGDEMESSAKPIGNYDGQEDEKSSLSANNESSQNQSKEANGPEKESNQATESKKEQPRKISLHKREEKQDQATYNDSQGLDSDDDNADIIRPETPKKGNEKSKKSTMRRDKKTARRRMKTVKKSLTVLEPQTTSNENSNTSNF